MMIYISMALLVYMYLLIMIYIIIKEIKNTKSAERLKALQDLVGIETLHIIRANDMNTSVIVLICNTLLLIPALAWPLVLIIVVYRNLFNRG